MKNNLNLNRLNAKGGGFPDQDDNSIEFQTASVSVYFKNIQEAIIYNINKADIVFGCVAWLTSVKIIDALYLKDNFSIIVSDQSPMIKLKKLRSHKNWIKINQLESDDNHFYTLSSAMHVGVEEGSVDATLSEVRRLLPEFLTLDSLHDQTDDSQALMHNKFLIFGKVDYSRKEIFELQAECWGKSNVSSDAEVLAYAKSRAKPIVTPYAVWTGSPNFTFNSELHLENGVLMHSESIAKSYFKEFCQIYLFSRSV